MSLPPALLRSLMNFPGSYVRDVKTKASSSIPPWQVIPGYIGAQCGRQEAWTTVDLALIRGLVPHDQGSSWGFLCLGSVEVHRELMTAATRWIMAWKLWSVLSARMAMRLNSLSLQKKFSIR